MLDAASGAALHTLATQHDAKDHSARPDHGSDLPCTSESQPHCGWLREHRHDLLQLARGRGTLLVMSGTSVGAAITGLHRVLPETTRVGWIGTGVMGASMCRHLLNAGYAVTVTTRTRDKAQPLIEAGACWADTPAQVANSADLVATMVGVPADVRSVFFGDAGVLAGVRSGAIVVDFTTSEPALAREIHARAQRRGVLALDAPVSGGDVGARQATLSIMVGGERQAFDALEKFWPVLGSRSVYQGASGSGQHTKMVNQILIASGMVGVCEALLYGYKAGLELERVLESVSSGAAGSWSLANLGPRILAGDFAPGFLVEHFIKDMAIALGEAERLQLALPGLALAQQLYRALQAQGHGRSGTHALQLALASLSGVDWPVQR